MAKSNEKVATPAVPRPRVVPRVVAVPRPRAVPRVVAAPRQTAVPPRPAARPAATMRESSPRTATWPTERSRSRCQLGAANGTES